MTRRIRLTNGKYTLVSDHRYEELRRFTWYDHGDGYVYRHGDKMPNGRPASILMHREILGLGNGKEDKRCADHINRNRRDNRDENLRIVDRFQNAHNRDKYACNKSGYKGVHKRQDGVYYSVIKLNGEDSFLGSFTDPVIAAHAYDNAARELHGEFAVTNFKDVMSDADILRGKRTRNSPRWGKIKRTRRVYWCGYDGIKVNDTGNYEKPYPDARKSRRTTNTM